MFTKLSRSQTTKAWQLKNSERYKRVAKQYQWFTQGIIFTTEQYNILFEKQLGCCAICGKHQHKFKNALAVDHDHKTGEIRGLLCNGCNRDVGVLEDSLKVLAVQKYLRK